MAERTAKTPDDISRELSHFMRKPERGGYFPRKKVGRKGFHNGLEIIVYFGPNDSGSGIFCYQEYDF